MNRALGWWVVLGLAVGCAATKSGHQQPAARAGASEQAMEVVPLQFAAADTVAEELRKLGSGAAQAGGDEPKVLVDPRTNSLILQGSREWLAKAKGRIAELDRAKQTVEVVPLRHAAATQLASTLNELLEASRRAIRFRGCALPQRGREVEMYRDDLPPAGREPRVEADPRANSLLVTAPDREDLPRLLELIARLDREEPSQH